LELNQLFSQMAVDLADVDGRDETIESVAEYARIAVGADDAGVMLVHGGDRVETPAGTSEDVDKAHQLQAHYGEGPCWSALAGGNAVYIVTETSEDNRWPLWGKAAAELGYHSVVSASLETNSRRIGSLNVYSRKPNAFDDSDAGIVDLLSGHATAAIVAAKTEADLKKALGSRKMIGQAEGILMHAYGIDSERAFAYLRRLSQDQNVKLVKIAESVIKECGNLGAT